MENYYIASVSFGKDSLAMLLKLIEENEPLNEVIFYDTGMEFQAIYNNMNKVKRLCVDNNIKFTVLTPECSFLYKMFEKPVCKKGTTEVHKFGYSWCGGSCRWGTTDKTQTVRRYLQSIKGVNIIQYIGYAWDEPMRIYKGRSPDKRFPLVRYGMTEQDCLEYCYLKGYDWNENGVELYSILKRVSCWCCANKNIKELRNIYRYLTNYWNKLKELQAKTDRPMKGLGKSVFELEERFRNET